MKDKRMIILAIFLLSAVSLFAAEPSRPPIVVQELGQRVVGYEAVRYPFFDNMDGEQACMNICAGLNDQPMPGTFEFRNILETTVNFDPDNGGIGTAYQRNANIFVTWTVRVVGESVFLPLWPSICPNGWHGWVNEIFSGGTVSTRLFVNGQPRGNIARMTIPSGEPQGRLTLRDPTIVGSALLTPDDFDGTFPDSLLFEVRWLNGTALTLTSPLDGPDGTTGDTTRNLIITIMPVQD